MDRRDYTDRVLSSLRRVTEKEREAIRSELDGHIEDHMEALRELGYDEELAEERAIAAMGEPDEVGRELNKQYPFRWLVAKWGPFCWPSGSWSQYCFFLGRGHLGFGQVLQSAGSQISATMLAHLAGSLLLSIPRWSSQLEMMWCG